MYEPEFEITPELAKRFQTIDSIRDSINKGPRLSEDILQKLEQEFIAETVYFSTKIEGSTLTPEETRTVLQRG